MIVSHRNKFIFFHNPKCAGTSFRDALKPYHDDPFTFWGIFYASYFKNRIDHTHLRLWEMQAQFPEIFARAETYNSVIFVRNPRERFLSAVNEHMKKFQPHVNLAAMEPARRTQEVERFIRQDLTIARITTDWRFIHFSPQLWYIRLGSRIVPRHILPMDPEGRFVLKAAELLRVSDLAMPRHNPSPVDLSAALQSDLVTRFIREFYADDIAFLRGDAHLAPLAAG